MIKKSKFFGIKELVPKSTYEKEGEGAWRLFDSKALEVLDWLRENIGIPMTVNNWQWGGEYHYRGWRPIDCTEGAKYSPHKDGCAFDISVKGWTDEQLKDWLKANESKLPHRIRVEIENTNSKVHFDTRPHNWKSNIYYFKP